MGNLPEHEKVQIIAQVVPGFDKAKLATQYSGKTRLFNDLPEDRKADLLNAFLCLLDVRLYLKNMIEITDIKLLPLPWSGKVMLFGTRSDEEKIKILTYLGIEWDSDTGKTGKCFANLTEDQKCEGLKAWQRSFRPALNDENLRNNVRFLIKTLD